VREKTGGSPFFAIQFISALAEEGLLRFDHDAARWHWQLDRTRVRVARAHEEFVVGGRFLFRRRGESARLLDVVKFSWEMVSARSGEVAGVGVEILLLDVDGRIRLDYQFIEG